MIIPNVHMNGTSGESLMDSMKKAVVAINIARKALSECNPNGRDYYLTDNINEAMKEQQSRHQRLESVVEELTEMAKGIYKQVK